MRVALPNSLGPGGVPGGGGGRLASYWPWSFFIMHVLYYTHPSLTRLLPGLELRICEGSVCCGRRSEGFGVCSEDWLHNWLINWCHLCLESGF